MIVSDCWYAKAKNSLSYFSQSSK